MKSNVFEVSASLDEYSDASVSSDTVIESSMFVVFDRVIELYAVVSVSDFIVESQIFVVSDVVVDVDVSALCSKIVEFQTSIDV